MTDRTEEATLTIGQFGRMSQLARKALRLYDDRDRLPPAHVEPDSGCRHYARRHLATARRIRLLRLMEMPLDKFAAVLAVWEEDPAGDPLALYYGPVNEEDDGPVEIAAPFTGLLPPGGDIKVRELPAHKVVQVRTFGEYNEYPKLLEMWNALQRFVEEENLEPDWGQDMTTYEIWRDDETMTICWPVQSFVGA